MTQIFHTHTSVARGEGAAMGNDAGDDGVLGKLCGDGAAGVGGGDWDGTERDVDGDGGGCHDAPAAPGVGRRPWEGRPGGI